jgi:hypothetical protein
MPRIIENKLIEEFKNKGTFSRDELFDFFRSFEPELKVGTFGWRIYDLRNKNIIKPLRRGVYTISLKTKYKPVISPDLVKVSKKILEKYDAVTYCVWENEWLNEFSKHQSGKRMLFIEVEKDLVDSIYYYLKDNFKFDLFLNPDEKAIDFYIAESNYPVIIKKLITRSPIEKRIENKIKIPTPLLEKILVDIFAEEKLFYFYQGSELRHIYENAIKSYTINFTRLFSYAGRREKENEIREYLTKNMGAYIKEFIND